MCLSVDSDQLDDRIATERCSKTKASVIHDSQVLIDGVPWKCFESAPSCENSSSSSRSGTDER